MTDYPPHKFAGQGNPFVAPPGGPVTPASQLDENFAATAPAINETNYPTGSAAAIRLAQIATANGAADDELANVVFPRLQNLPVIEKIGLVWNALEAVPSLTERTKILNHTQSAVDHGVYLQAAHDALKAAGGGILKVTGLWSIQTMVTIDPSYVTFEGSGCGVPVLGIASQSEIRWTGASAAEAAVRIGYGTTMLGGNGGIRNIHVNANSLANRALAMCDFWNVTFEGCAITRALVDCLYLTNTSDGTVTIFPSGFCVWDNNTVMTRDYGTVSGTSRAVNVDGKPGSGSGAVTVMNWGRLQIFHDNGTGLRVGTHADNHYFHQLGFGKTSDATGFSLATRTDAVQGIGNWYFAGVTSLQSINIPVAHTALNWTFELLNDTDLGVKSDNSPVLFTLTGNGATDVRVLNSFSGRKFGDARIPGRLSTGRADRMLFARYDSANAEMLTGANRWKVDGVNLPAAPFASANQTGTAVTVTTNTAVGDMTMFGDFFGSYSANGVLALTQKPYLTITVAPVQATGLCIRVGYFGDKNDPPTNFIGCELDTSVSGLWRGRCIRGGSSTEVTSGLGSGVGVLVQLNMSIQGHGAGAGAVNITGRPNAQLGQNVFATITTNIPETGLSFGVQVIARTAGAKSALIYEMQDGVSTEGA